MPLSVPNKNGKNQAVNHNWLLGGGLVIPCYTLIFSLICVACTMNILFITSNRVGDAVLSTGVLDWLVRTYPSAQFTIATGPYAADLFRATPRLKSLIILRKASLNRHWLGLWRACIGTRWDIIVDLRNSLISRLLWRGKLWHHQGKTGLHKVVENARVLHLDPPPSPTIYLDQASEQQATALLPPTSDNAPMIALGPAANWACKQWPIENFTALAKHLIAPDGSYPNARIVILADTKEREQIVPLLDALPPERRLEVIGQSLPVAAACLKRCRLFIGNDSGLMHLAAAVGTPTLGLFGPGYEEIYAPWGSHAAYIRTSESRKELLARIPYPGANHPNLMQGLTVERVADKVRNLLNSGKSL